MNDLLDNCKQNMTSLSIVDVTTVDDVGALH